MGLKTQPILQSSGAPATIDQSDRRRHRLDVDGTRKVIHKAIDLGITLFYTTDVYGNRGGS